ncbi:MAG: oligosaccharide flippase family protein [Deltaproteobacteria bacterium]|nr:oligosaccharide flippase family protein [Deltaproteobacteria bacterium]
MTVAPERGWVARLLTWLSPGLDDPAAARQLAWGTAGTMTVRVLASGLNLVTGMVLARLLLTRGYGIFVFCWASVDFLFAVADLGMSTLVTQRTAAYAAQRKWSRLRGLLRRADQIVALMSVLAVTAGGVALGVGALGGKPNLALTFLLALPIVPLLGLTNLRRSVLLGLERPVLSQLVRYVARPLVFWAIVALAYLLGAVEPSAPSAMACELLACAAILGLSVWAVRRFRPTELTEASPSYATRAWLLAAIPMLAIAHLNTFVWRLDIIMVGALATLEGAGIYGAATQWAGVVTYPFLALTIVLSPVVSRLHARGDTATLQAIVTAGIRLATGVSTVLLVGLWLTGPWLLGIYGSDFVAGTTALTILGVGQLLTMVFGPVWIILVMTGHARVVALLLGCSAVINVSLDALLIPIWGLEGAALGSALVVNIFRVVGVWLVWRRLSLRATIWG